MSGKKTNHFLLTKAKYWSRILSFLPGVEAIFLSGSLAHGKANPNSDIDFFILATPGRIWTVRFWVFLILKLSGNLAKPFKHKGRICPNHFITIDALEIADKNPYSANLFAQNQPLYDPKNYFQDFALANSWVTGFGESFPVQIVEVERVSRKKAQKKTSFVECFLKRIQIAKIQNNSEFSTPEAKIVLTDKELRFHPNPRSKHWKKNEKKLDDFEIVVNGS